MAISSIFKCAKFFKQHLIIIVLAFTSNMVYTQTVVTIGTGTFLDRHPFGVLYGYERNASLYKSVEIGTSGIIKKIAWFPEANQTTQIPIKIYLKSTSLNVLSTTTWSSMQTGATLVYEGTIVPVANQWFELILNTPFVHDNANNLLVLVETNYGGIGIPTSGSQIRSSNFTDLYQYWQSDNTPPTGTGELFIYRPNIRLTMDPPAFPFDAGITEITNLSSGCTRSSQTISVKIKNYGSNNITSGLPVTYTINPGNISVTENLPTSIISQTIINYTFNTIIDLTSFDSLTPFIIKVYTNLTSDGNHNNDSIAKFVVSLGIPDAPIPNNINSAYGCTAELTANSDFPIYWYDDEIITNHFYIGNSFTTPILTDTATYYISSKSTTKSNVKIGINQSNQGYNPANSTNKFSWGASIYKASEIKQSMYIDSVGWDVNTITSSYSMVNQKVYFAHISDSIFTSNSYINPSNMKLVFDGNVVWQSASTNKLKLIEPFYYNGTDNLLVIYENRNNNNSAVGLTFQGNSTFPYLAKYSFSNASFPAIAGVLTYTRPNIHFINLDKGCFSDRVPISAYVTSPPAQNASLKRIVEPLSGTNLNHEIAKVVVENKGIAPITNIPIFFSINNQEIIVDTILSTIQPSDSLTYTLDKLLNFENQYGICNLKAWTSLTGDIVHFDDTAYKTITNSLALSCASNATNALIQDIGNVTFAGINNGTATPVTMNPNAINTYSDFTFLAPALVNQGSNYPISISQITAGGFYAANVKAYIDFNKNNIFDLPQEQVFSATTSSTNTTLTGNIYIPLTASLGYVRMRIVMDMNTSALPCGTYTYGETEDYAVKIHAPIMKDLEITEIIGLADTVVENSSFQFKAIIKNLSTVSISPSDSAKIKSSLNNGNIQSITYLETLLPNASDTINLSGYSAILGDMNICAFAVLNNDNNSSNDTICSTIYGKRISDIGILAINQPNGILYAGDSSLIDVEIKNFGTHTISSFPISYQINQNVINEIFTGSIAPNSSVDFSFAQKILIPQNNFNIKCYTSLPADQIRSNDSLLQNISVQPKPSDAGVTSIVNPAVQVYAQDSVEVTVSIKNYGMTTLTNIPLAYKVNGVLKSLEICNNVIQPNASINYTFLQKFLAPSNNFNIQSYSNIANDFDRTNDSISASINVVLPPTIDIGITALQSPENSIYAGDSTTVIISIKNYGSNAANNFSVSYKINNVLIANETCTTAINSNSTLDYTFSKKFMPPASDFNLMAYVSFAGDGNNINDTIKSNINIIIPSSIDAGITNVLAPTTSLYHMDSAQVTINIKNYGTDAIANIPVGYKINGLVNVSEICNTSIAPNTNANYTFNKKFCVPANNFSIKTFCSLPDDIYRLNDTLSKSITQVHPAHIDGAITAINLPAINSLANDSSVVQIVIKNSGSDYMFYVPITYQINNETPVSDMFVGFINVNTTANFSFKKKIKIPTDDFILKVFCSVANDLIHNNDTIVSNINIVKPMYDAAIVDIIQPADTSYYGQNTSVLVQIKNFGSQSIQNFPVSYKYGNSAVITENIVISIAADDTYNYLFNTSYVSDSTLYNLCAYTALAIDMVNANNQFCRQIRGVVGIDEYKNEGLYLWQNMPNPATDNTIIMLSLHKTCKANLIIRNMFGQIVYETCRTFPEGKSYLNVDLSNFSAGVYTYCLEYNGLKLIKKMIVSQHSH